MVLGGSWWFSVDLSGSWWFSVFLGGPCFLSFLVLCGFWWFLVDHGDSCNQELIKNKNKQTIEPLRTTQNRKK